MDQRFWDNYSTSRSTTIEVPKMFFCLLASELGYSNKEIGGFIRKRASSVEHYIQELKNRAGAGCIEEAKAKIIR